MVCRVQHVSAITQALPTNFLTYSKSSVTWSHYSNHTFGCVQASWALLFHSPPPSSDCIACKSLRLTASSWWELPGMWVTHSNVWRRSSRSQLHIWLTEVLLAHLLLKPSFSFSMKSLNWHDFCSLLSCTEVDAQQHVASMWSGWWGAAPQRVIYKYCAADSSSTFINRTREREQWMDAAPEIELK